MSVYDDVLDDLAGLIPQSSTEKRNFIKYRINYFLELLKLEKEAKLKHDKYDEQKERELVQIGERRHRYSSNYRRTNKR